MSRADHRNIKLSYTFQSLQHKWLERSDDAVKIIFRCPHIAFPVCHLADQHILKSIVGAEGIAGHKHLFFFNKGVHRIRPVQIRNQQKTQRFVPDLHRLVVMHDQIAEFAVYDLL